LRILLATVLILTMLPAMLSSAWKEILVVFSLNYILGICFPLWVKVSDRSQNSYASFLVVSALMALMAPVATSTLANIIFAVPMPMSFPIELSGSLFLISNFLWVTFRFVRNKSPTLISLGSVVLILCLFLSSVMSPQKLTVHVTASSGAAMEKSVSE
jgi:hypothetical protein